MTFDAEKEISEITIWQAPCGCWKSKQPGRRPWFYKPCWDLYHWWKPFWLGGDEYCRRTLVIGTNLTGQIIIPLWYCRGDKGGDDWCGCGPDNFDGPTTDSVLFALKMHRTASKIMHTATAVQYREWEKRDPLDSL